MNVQTSESFARAKLLFSKALSEIEREDYRSADDLLSQALALAPDRPSLLINRSAVKIRLGQASSALALARAARALTSDKDQLAECALNEIAALELLGHMDEALAIIESLDPEVAQQPKFVAHRVELLAGIKAWDELVTLLQQHLTLWGPTGTILGDYLAAQERAVNFERYDETRASVLQSLDSGEICDRPFHFTCSFDDPARAFLLAKMTSEKGSQSSPDKSRRQSAHSIGQGSQMTLGFVSADFRNHPTSLLIHDFLGELLRLGVRTVGYWQNDYTETDEFCRRIRSRFSENISISNASDHECSEIIRDQGISHLIDLSGHTAGNRLRVFRARPSPRQYTWLGYPGTTGMKEMDFIIADQYTIPNGQEKNYSETVLRMPEVYQPRSSILHRHLVDSARRTSRADWNLPEDSFIYGMFCNEQKVNPWILDRLGEILAAVKDSTLWVLSPSEAFESRVRRELARLSKLPEVTIASRVIFARRVELGVHLERHRHVDLFLETFPYGAHTTALDSLLMSRPTLSRVGNSFQSRVSGSLLNSCGLNELVCKSDQEYTRKAVALGTNTDEIGALRHKINQANYEKNHRFTENFTQSFMSLINK